MKTTHLILLLMLFTLVCGCNDRLGKSLGYSESEEPGMTLLADVETEIPEGFDISSEPYSRLVMVKDGMLASGPLDQTDYDAESRCLRESYIVEAGTKVYFVIELRKQSSKVFQLEVPELDTTQGWTAWVTPTWEDSTGGTGMDILKNREQDRVQPSDGPNFRIRLKYKEWVSPSASR